MDYDFKLYKVVNSVNNYDPELSHHVKHYPVGLQLYLSYSEKTDNKCGMGILSKKYLSICNFRAGGS